MADTSKTQPEGADLVLLVEDDVEQAESVAALLARDGYRVLRANNGAEAIKLLESGCRPQLICCDLMMPVMSGWELIEKLRSSAFGAIPVISWSGDDFHQDAVGAQFLRKPISPQKLLRVVRSRLSRPL